MEGKTIAIIASALFTIALACITTWQAIKAQNEADEDKKRADRLDAENKQLLRRNLKSANEIILQLTKASEDVTSVLNNSKTTIDSLHLLSEGLNKQIEENIRTQQLITESGNKLVKNVEKLNEEITNNLIGGDSYLLMQISDIDHEFGFGHWIAIPKGKYPMREVSVEILDLNKPESLDPATRLNAGQKFTLREVYPNRAIQLELPPVIFDKEKGVNFSIFIGASNGFTSQTYRMRYVNGRWVTAMKIGPQIRQSGKPELFESFIDTNYPEQNPKTIFK